MRLLNTRTGRLESFNDSEVPRYAILSHVWDKNEQTFQEVEKLGRKLQTRARSLLHALPPGLSAKLRGACEFAAARGYDWIWVDTCCINKESSAELSEAINSMFKWYAKADACIAYLADVPDDSRNLMWHGSALWKSRWFTRGWTLQELIAPRKVLFVLQGWKLFGTKLDLAETLQTITGVNKEVLTLTRSLSTISIAERMSWAANRETTRVEDRAYSLLGIFGVHMSTLYGEGANAFRRLQEELLRSSPDQTLFAWEFPLEPAEGALGLFADSPSRFDKRGLDLEGLAALTIEEIPIAAGAFRAALGLSSAVSCAESDTVSNISYDEPASLPYDTPACSLTNYGVRARIPVVSRPAGNEQSGYAVAILAAAHKSGYVGLVLQRLLEVESTHYAVGMHGTRLIHVDVHPHGDPSPCGWAKELDLAHDDVIIRWEDIYITTTEPWNAQIRPAVADMPLKMLSGIPASDLNYFHSKHHHSLLTRRCLSLMNNRLRQDLCGIGDFSLRNEDVPNLANRIANNVPEEVQHACKLWLTHLPLSSPDSDLLQELSTFANQHVLHWVEALSLLKELRVSLDGLPAIFDWLSKHARAAEGLLRDADRMIRANRDVLSTSALQLYNGTLTLMLPNCDLLRKFPPPEIKLLSPRRGWSALRGEMKHRGGVNSVAFLPDNVHIASGSGDGSVSIWNTRTLECVNTFTGGHHRTVHAVTCSTGGKFVASCGDADGVALWDVGTGTLVRVLPGQGRSQQAVAFSADSTRIAAGSNNGSVRVWSVTSGEIIRAFAGHTGYVAAVAFSRADRTRLASGSLDGTIKIWNTDTGAVLRILRGGEGWVTSIAFSHDGSRIASGSTDRNVRIWDAVTGELVRTIQGHSDRITFVAFVPYASSSIFSSSREGTIKEWDATTGRCLSTLTSSHGALASFSISRDGSRIASTSGETIEIWDAKAHSDSGPELEGHKGPVSAVDFAPNGKIFATSSLDRTVRLWKTRTANLLMIIPHHSSVHAARFSPDGTVLATASADLVIRLFETGSWKEAGHFVWPAHLDPGEVWSLAFSADGTRLACGTNHSVVAWDVGARAQIAAFRVEHRLNTLAFSPDMTWIATGLSTENAGRADVWDVTTGTRVAVLRRRSRMHSLRFSSDGRHVLWRGYDGSIGVDAIPCPTLPNPPPAGVDEAPLRFSWQPIVAGEKSDLGWLHFTSGVDQEFKRVCWFPPERRPSYYNTCYAWRGNIVVVGSPNGAVTVLDFIDAVQSL